MARLHERGCRACQLFSRRLFLQGGAGVLAGATTVLGPANADTRRQLTLVRPATGEVALNVPFWWAGVPYEQGLVELNWLLRDLQAAEVHPIDLRVYYILAVIQAEFGRRPVLVTSGYRTQATNEQLRVRGTDTARNSFHLCGCAADIQMPGVAPGRIAELGSLLGLGGVGLYGSFVHLDTGPRRTWKG